MLPAPKASTAHNILRIRLSETSEEKTTFLFLDTFSHSFVSSEINEIVLSLVFSVKNVMGNQRISTSNEKPKLNIVISVSFSPQK